MASYRPPIGNGFLIKLTDIEARYRTTLYEVLLDASNKRINLLFEVPLEKKLILLPSPAACDCERPPVGVPHPFNTKPDYLALLPGACEQLIREPFVQTKYSATGYARKWARNWLNRAEVNEDGEAIGHLSSVICELIALPAKDVDNNSEFPSALCHYPEYGTQRRPWVHWGLDSGNPYDPAAWFKIEIEHLYVITQEFFSLKGWAKNSIPSDDFWFRVMQGKAPGKNNPKENLNFISEQLLRACEASEKLWGCETVIPWMKDTHPTNDEVVRWLMDQDLTFTKTAAKHAANLIEPAFAENSSPLVLRDEKRGENDRHRQRYSDYLMLACEASLALWGSKRVIPEDRDTHPSNPDVLAWLRKKIPSIKKDTAEQIASLIRPSFSEGRGRRSK